MHVTKPINLTRLTEEMAAAGISLVGPLAYEGAPEDGEVYTYAPDEHNILVPAELPPEAEAVVEAHDGTVHDRATVFESAEDAERIAVINERAQIDPAYAALVEMTLGKQGLT